ncbi:MAG TPA: molybdopterin cofactor-binding domain-containing protein [Bacteroidales bacterium]|nr:molybdopterin cofactor-binding domain-containing protein [Bacteroidales bacterium]
MNNIDSVSHTTGKSVYLDDIPVLKNTLYGVVFDSPLPHATITDLDVTWAQLVPGVERIFTWRDIPGKNDIGGIISDETLFAAEEVHYRGQPVALIVASDEHTARKALELIDIETGELEVITDPRKAHEKGLLLIPSRTFRMGDISSAWSECDHIFGGTATSGGQEHLYLETQGAYAYPSENGGIKIHSSTQGPALVQKITARVLGIPMNRVEVDVTRLGGAFGGKEDQATATAVMAALASFLLHRPVKIALHRLDDMRMTGKRHPYSSDFRIGLTKDYKIKAYSAVMFQNGGAAADLSPAIMERTLFHSTNAYFIPNTEVTVHSCRTNLPPNTAFRGFGTPQGMFVIEAAIAKAAEELGVPAHIIQRANFLSEGDEFQYGQQAENVNIGKCRDDLDNKFDIAKIEKEISDFNSKDSFRKRGMAMMPVCFGLSFTNTSMNQARALVHIYQDGSIGISTGAVEMGQGVNTKLAQVAAKVLSVDEKRIKLESTNTTRVANTSPTSASSGADLNGNALRIACTEILKRLISTAAIMHDCSTEEIEILNEQVVKNGLVTETTWEELVHTAFLKRVALTENGHYSTPEIYFDKTKEKGHPFAYHVYGTAVVTVTLDCLRGTYKVDDVLIVHDFGNSLNPVIDLGQIEGGVMQGIGWMTIEEVIFNDAGRLLSNSLSTYKVPDIYSAPARVMCYALETSGPDLAIFRSKAIGEPPFMYGIGAYFALCNAIKSFKPGTNTDFDAPLTPEKVLMRLYNH